MQYSTLTNLTTDDLKQMANSIRALSMDAVQQAKSGHPGMPMGMADVATVLFSKFLKFAPTHPAWPDRDRVVLSAGHGSMLLYSLLYLTGYDDITIDDVKNFRQLGHKCAGHPEFGHISGIETTTGPLGQGVANAVGMAMAERKLNDQFGDDIINHKTYVIAGDGCLMEGISQEAITLAGHLKLNNLILLFDDNGISIDGPLSLTDSTDQIKRFEAANWHCITCDGHDYHDIEKSLQMAHASDRPVMIAFKTTIGYGSPNKAGKSSAHGAPLGEDEIISVRQKLGWPHKAFDIPDDILNLWRALREAGHENFTQWQKNFDRLDANIQNIFTQYMQGTLPDNYHRAVADYKKTILRDKPHQATRVSSQKMLEAITPEIANMLGGSADLTGSNNTKTPATAPISANDFSGRYIYYGIRELAMAAAMNGMALHGGIIPYGGTFFVFSDYARPAMRLSALMGIRVIYVMTHDSIGLGEDGPTHQPVEHLAALRAIPNLSVFRPCDALEVAECWDLALQCEGAPSVLALTRQNLPLLRDSCTENMCTYGGYILKDNDAPALNLIASGSEVEIACKAHDILKENNISARIISMPCLDLFMAQDANYKNQILGGRPNIVIEAGIQQGWDGIIGTNGGFIGMNGFGASGPYQELYEHFGITPDHVVALAHKVMS